MNGSIFGLNDNIRSKVNQGWGIPEFLKEYNLSNEKELHEELKKLYARRPQDFRKQWSQIKANTDGGKGAISMKRHNKKTTPKVVEGKTAENDKTKNVSPEFVLMNGPTMPSTEFDTGSVTPVLDILSRVTESGNEKQRFLEEIDKELDATIGKEFAKILSNDNSKPNSEELDEIAILRKKIETATNDIASFEAEIKSYRRKYRDDCVKVKEIYDNLDRLKNEMIAQKEQLNEIYAEIPELEKKTSETIQLKKLAEEEKKTLEEELRNAMCKTLFCGKPDSECGEYDYILSKMEIDDAAINARGLEMFKDLATYGELTGIEMMELAKILIAEESITEDPNIVKIFLESSPENHKVAKVLQKIGRKAEVIINVE